MISCSSKFDRPQRLELHVYNWCTGLVHKTCEFRLSLIIVDFNKPFIARGL